MSKAVLLDVDTEGEIWIDATAPIEVLTEKAAPFRVAIRGRVAGQGDLRAAVWLRTERLDVPRLIDNLTRALDDARRLGADAVVRPVVVRSPSNGGINSENGNLSLALNTVSGAELRLEVPYPQSGTLLEVVNRAVSAAAKWHDDHNPDIPGTPREYSAVLEVEQIQVAEEVGGKRPLLSVRLTGGAQFAFLLDRKMLEELRSRRVRKPEREDGRRQRDLYSTVADEIEWLHDEWCVTFAPPSDAALRRGSAALRLLLTDNGIQKAWRHHGLNSRQPEVFAPDVEALAKEQGFELRHAAALVAGGGCVDGIETAMLGMVATYNPKTGQGPDAESGFAVMTTYTVRDARGEYEIGPLHQFVRRTWKLNEYLRSVSVVRRGKTASRGEVVQYFANFAGGVHLGRVSKGGREDAKERNELIAELEGNCFMTSPRITMDGLHFELLSIGQALGNSPDLLRLAATIREAEASAPS
ncbi:MAG TPA: hypothetical protein VN634_12725 [Candidatus Limnocylindrales bacterium]|nr:hypothetical protein [Candidatus Limnocylindrales bacterium]